jgi:excisionase family DNA binding protein
MEGDIIVEPPVWLTAREVADLFRVQPNTVYRWTNAGKLACIRTPGGQRRYDEAAVMCLYYAGGTEREPGGVT